MIKKIKNFIYTHIAPTLLYWIIKVYSSTFRFSVKGEQNWINIVDQENKSVLLACWHQQFLGAIHFFRKYKKYSPNIMISQSKDGEFIAKIAKKSHWNPIRGSSSRGKVQAAKGIVQAMKTNPLGAHVVDGPLGPMGKIKPGLIEIALLSDSTIVPFYIVAPKAWYANSWDYFMIPKPFSKVQLIFDDPIDPNDLLASFANDLAENDPTLSKQNKSTLATKQIEKIMLPFLIPNPKK